jgi:cation diffusion facilitator family transporter
VQTQLDKYEAGLKGIHSTLIGVSANAILAAVKAIAGVAGNSYALLADAVESTADIFSTLIVMGGLKIATVPADKDHPYGHGKAEPLASMVVAIALCTAAVAIAIESIREIHIPHHAPAPFTLIVLVLVIITKESLFRFVFRTGECVESTALKVDAWHHRSDALTSAAAFVGISIALLGGPGYESADDWAALFASAVILYNGCRLLVPAVNEVMDAAPHPSIEDETRRVAKEVPGVVALEKCFVRKMGLEYYVDFHVVVDGSISVHEGHEIAHKVKDAIRAANPRITDVLIHIEPNNHS